jgi:hypothetical protein
MHALVGYQIAHAFVRAKHRVNLVSSNQTFLWCNSLHGEVHESQFFLETKLLMKKLCGVVGASKTTNRKKHSQQVFCVGEPNDSPTNLPVKLLLLTSAWRITNKRPRDVLHTLCQLFRHDYLSFHNLRETLTARHGRRAILAAVSLFSRVDEGARTY